MERVTELGVEFTCDRCGKLFATLTDYKGKYVSHFELREGTKVLIGPPQSGELCKPCTEELINWYFAPCEKHEGVSEKENNLEHGKRKSDFRKLCFG